MESFHAAPERVHKVGLIPSFLFVWSLYSSFRNATKGSSTSEIMDTLRNMKNNFKG